MVVGTVVHAGTPQVPAGRRRPQRRDGALIVLIAPAVVWFAAFMLLPLASMFYLSATSWRTLVAPRTFVGLAQYGKVLTDPIFLAAARNTAIEVLAAVPAMTFLAFMLAYYISLRPPGVAVLRVVCFVPALMSVSAKSMMFLGTLAPNGLVNAVLQVAGLSGLRRAWLADQHTALAAVIAIDLWGGIGYTAVLLNARLSDLSPEVMEAARLDGAGHWRTMWAIAFPMMADYVGALFMLQFLWTAFGSAALILLLTNGGPGTATYTLSFLVYVRAFQQQNVGYSQVVGVVLFVAGLLGMAAIRRLFRSKV